MQRTMDTENPCGHGNRTCARTPESYWLGTSIVGQLGLEVYLGSFGVEGKGDRKDEGKREKTFPGHTVHHLNYGRFALVKGCVGHC